MLHSTISPEAMARSWGVKPLTAYDAGEGLMSAAFWRLAHARPTELSCAPDPDTHILSIHLTPGFRFKFFVDGRSAYERVGGPGTVNLVKAGESPRSIVAEGEAAMLHLYLPVALVRACAEASYGGRGETVELIDPGVAHDAECERIGHAILAEMRRAPEPPSRLLLDSFALGLSTHLVRRWSNLASIGQARHSGGLSLAARRRVVERIEADLSEDLSMDTLAAEAGLSASQFREAFRQTLGTTPSGFVLARRIERAKALLAQGDATIAEVAVMCGFADQPHLTRRFRQATGLTPKAYRDQLS